MGKVDFTILDPMGNLTALVQTKIPKGLWSLVTKKIMADYPTVEQVGFIINNNLEMMGGELSINGTLAAGYYLSKKYGQQKLAFKINLASGFSLLKFSLIKKFSTILLTIPYKKVKIDGFDFVDLGGIGYFVVPIPGISGPLIPGIVFEFEKFKEKFEKRLNRNAWGVVFYKGNKIWPVVYVKDKKGKTLEKRLEMACGSGSLAYYLVSGKEKIIQPSEEIIRIKRKEEKFEISGKVKMCYDKRSLYD